MTTDDAHAWVEYYVDGLGWYVLDPTPAMQDSHILTLQPDNSSETDPAPTQEEDQVQQVPETLDDRNNAGCAGSFSGNV